MKKTYNTPEYELILIADDDIITASTTIDGGKDGEDLGMPELPIT